MKNGLIVIFLLLSFSVFAQPTVTEQFRKINTLPEAQAWVGANAALKPAILHLSNQKDSSLIDKRLLRQQKGEIFSVGYVTYKVIEYKDTVNFRASYIFLDGASLSPTQIDSMKKIIIQKASAGSNWEQLSDQYTMDGNTTHGDTGWFFGPEMLPKEFQDGVQSHKFGEIFTVDVSEKQWHYIVKKTYEDREQKEMTVLRANGR
jgi:hypothetical protein